MKILVISLVLYQCSILSNIFEGENIEGYQSFHKLDFEDTLMLHITINKSLFKSR